MTNLAIARQLMTTRLTVARWFATKRMDGPSDEPRPAAPRKIRDHKITGVVTVTLQTMPSAASHSSTRSIAKASGRPTSNVPCI